METRSSSEGSLASSAADDTEGKSTEVLLEELASDYSKFMHFDVSKEQNKFSESIESMLTKLEEFCGLVDMIRSDTTLCLTKTMPEIQTKCKEMQDMFDRIDRLEAFVGVVKRDMAAVEESVNKAETELSSGTLIKRLSSLVSSKKSPGGKTAQKVQYAPPHIFHTDRYLVPDPATAEGEMIAASSNEDSTSLSNSEAAAATETASSTAAT